MLDAHAPCPRCGRTSTPAGASGAPAASPAEGDDWDDLGGGIDRGGGMVATSGAPSAYSGGGMALGDDDPFADDASGGGTLELDVPHTHAMSAPPAGARSLPVPQPFLGPQSALRPPPRIASLPPQTPSAPQPRAHPSLSVPGAAGSLPVPGPASMPVPGSTHDPAAALIARFPEPPMKVWEAPIYAARVLYRQMELRQDLESLRRKRSPDVALYERALKAHDARTFTLGLAIGCACLAVAGFVFFLPVLLRFLRAPD